MRRRLVVNSMLRDSAASCEYSVCREITCETPSTNPR